MHAVSSLQFRNATLLDDHRLMSMFERGVAGWRTGEIDLRVRYSRGADFSGACYYKDQRILINLGRHLVYPYLMHTHLARAVTRGRRWYKPRCTIELRDPYLVVLFVFMHELFHLLVKRAKRNPRQKESMCDRFAARHLVDGYGCRVCDGDGSTMPRVEWDFQDLDGFVARVASVPTPRKPVVPPVAAMSAGQQLWLFRT